MTERVVIMGAAGRDFHDFNTVFRGDPDTTVVAFTAAPEQNLGEADEAIERYPPELAGDGYPDGVPIRPENELETIVTEEGVDTVVFSYSDVAHEDVMGAASRALAAGADFRLIGPEAMQLPTSVPVLAVDAVRTGCGKSGVALELADELESRGVDVAVVREPMPYGDLLEKRVERFATQADLEGLTIEEREEYEPHVEAGHTVFAGVDYDDVRAAAEAEAEVLLWDGGNNELPFYEPDLHLVLADPLRPGVETNYHPGEANLRDADEVLINKENSADEADIETVLDSVREANPDANLKHADSVVSVEHPERVAGSEVLVVEDGPTLTHGDAPRGAGAVAAEKFDAVERIDPRGKAVGSLAAVLEEYPHLEKVLPAMGYSESQRADLEATIESCEPELVLAGTPHDLDAVLDVEAPVERVRYRVEPKGWSYAGLVDSYADTLTR